MQRDGLGVLCRLKVIGCLSSDSFGGYLTSASKVAWLSSGHPVSSEGLFHGNFSDLTVRLVPLPMGAVVWVNPPTTNSVQMRPLQHESSVL